MKTTIKRMNPKLVKWFLPWVATLITAVPYSDCLSRFFGPANSPDEGVRR